MEIFKANRQWSSRPKDERFPSIQALYDATKGYAEAAKVAHTPFSNLRVEAVGENVALTGKAGVPAQFTNWAFKQLCARVKAPADFLSELPPTLTAQNLNHRLAHTQDGKEVHMMFHQNGGLILRALTSAMYERIWNFEVAERLLALESLGWAPAMPTMWKSGNDFPSLYASDHDMFAFVMKANAVIHEAGTDQPMYRGVIVENSEVGASALKLTRFLFRAMCGNHIIWGASKVLEISLRHVGSIREKFGEYSAELKRYAESSPSDEEAQIASAKSKIIAADKKELLDKLFGIKPLNMSRKAIEASYDAVVPSQDGNPLTKWGIVQGITRHSQTIPYADQRTALDKAAGKLMEIEF